MLSSIKVNNNNNNIKKHNDTIVPISETSEFYQPLLGKCLSRWPIGCIFITSKSNVCYSFSQVSLNMYCPQIGRP